MTETQVGAVEDFSPFGAHLQDPYQFYAEARDKRPVFHSEQFDLWFVTRYDDIVRILRDPVTYSSRDTVPQHPFPPEVMEVLAGYRQPAHLINSDPPQHTRLRAIMNQGFSPTAVNAMEPAVRSIANELIDSFVHDGKADLVGQFAYPLPLRVILLMLGVPDEEIEQCRIWSADLATISWGWAAASTERLVEASQGAVAFQRYTETLVAERAARPKEDLISRALHAEVKEHTPLSQEEVVDLVPGLILAGHETTANLIGNTMYLLLNHPEAMAKVLDDPGSLQAALEESLRYDSSILGMPRTATVDVEIGGASIAAGQKLFLLFGSANHDGTHYPEPERFRLDREKSEPHLAFSRGLHFCIGAALARLEGKIAVELLLERLPNLRAPGEEPRRNPSFIFRGYSRLDAEWDAAPAPG